MDSNRTHSSCACTHLTTFGLLANSDDLIHPHLSHLNHHHPSIGGQQEQEQNQHQQPAAKVQLESVESGIFLPAFDGHLNSGGGGESSPSSLSPSSSGYKLLYLIKVSRTTKRANRLKLKQLAFTASGQMIDLCRWLGQSFACSLVCIH